MCTFLLKYHIIKWNNNEILNDKLLPHLFYVFPKIEEKEDYIFQHELLFNNNYSAQNHLQT